jgi:hypothetical protein
MYIYRYPMLCHICDKSPVAPVALSCCCMLCHFWIRLEMPILHSPSNRAVSGLLLGNGCDKYWSRCVKTFMKGKNLVGKFPTREESYQVLSIICKPISPLCRVNLGFGSAFVNTSAVCSGSLHSRICTVSSATRSQIQWCLKAIRFDLGWNCIPPAIAIDLSLSALMFIGIFCGKPSSLKNCRANKSLVQLL